MSSPDSGVGEARDFFNFKEISLEIRYRQAEVTLLSRVLNQQTLQELKKVINICQNDSIEKVIITGSGRFFCLGGDVREFQKAGEHLPELVQQMAADLKQIILGLAVIKKPVIVIVNGLTAGAGLSITTVADRAIALNTANFASGYATINFPPDGGLSYTLPRKIKRRDDKNFEMQTKEVIGDNLKFSAEQACQMGIVDEVVSSMAEAVRLARETAGDLQKFVINTSEFSRVLDEEIKEVVLRAGTEQTQNLIRQFGNK